MHSRKIHWKGMCRTDEKEQSPEADRDQQQQSKGDREKSADDAWVAPTKLCKWLVRDVEGRGVRRNAEVSGLRVTAEMATSRGTGFGEGMDGSAGLRVPGHHPFGCPTGS